MFCPIVALLAGGEGVLDALLPPDLGAVIDAGVDGVQGLGLSLVNGAPNAPAIVCCAAAVPSTPLAFQRQEGFFSSIAQVPGLDDGNLITLGTGSLDPVTEPEDQPKGPDITDRKVTPLTGNLSAALSRIQDRFTERAGTPTAKTEKPAGATTVLKRPSSLRNVVTQGLFGHRKDRLGQQQGRLIESQGDPEPSEEGNQS